MFHTTPDSVELVVVIFAAREQGVCHDGAVVLLRVREPVNRLPDVSRTHGRIAYAFDHHTVALPVAAALV